jgi:hypothetical protein
VVVPTQAALARAIATHGVVNVAALSVTKADDGRAMWVGASGAKAEVVAVDEVTTREAEIQNDWDGVQLSPSVSALESVQSFVIRWGVASMEEFSRRALLERVGDHRGSCGMDLPGDTVRQHGDQRRVRT